MSTPTIPARTSVTCGDMIGGYNPNIADSDPGYDQEGSISIVKMSTALIALAASAAPAGA
jgi:hypothetical protein